MLGKVTPGRKRMESLYDMMEGRDYGQLKDLISDRSRWRQDSENACEKPAGNSRRLKEKKHHHVTYESVGQERTPHCYNATFHTVTWSTTAYRTLSA